MYNKKSRKDAAMRFSFSMNILPLILKFFTTHQILSSIVTQKIMQISFLFPATFLITIIFLAATGNILVCLAIATERSLRRIGNLFLASLAIADLFVSLLVMTFAGVNDILGS